MSNLFPVCASFGPLFIAMGSIYPNGGYGFLISAPGALMTSAALMTIFREYGSINKRLSDAAAVSQPSEGQGG